MRRDRCPHDGTPKRKTVHMKDPLEILETEHREGLEILRRMESAAFSIEKDGFSAGAFDEIGQAVRLIDAGFRAHMEKEERFLFPLLARHGNGSLRTLCNEHLELWNSRNDLYLCLRDVEEGRVHSKSINELLRRVKLFVEHLREHIEKERTIVLPLTRQVLSRDEYEELGEQLAQNTSIA